MQFTGNQRYYPRPLIFLHIPKAAGSTLQEIVVRQFPGGRGYRFTGAPTRLKEFQDLSVEERAKFDVLTGHVHYGIHRHLPGPATYMTMLRDPVERVISHYYFVLRSPDHYLYPIVTGRKQTLHDYVQQKTTIELDNDQTRYLLQKEHQEMPHGYVKREHLTEAKETLEAHFPVIGLCERFDESLVMMQCVYGWLDVSYEKKNVTADRPRAQEVPPETIDLIRETNKYDMELYELAVRLFERQVAALGPAFDQRMRAFRAGAAQESAARPAAQRREPALQ